jgi:hypothetical protein
MQPQTPSDPSQMSISNIFKLIERSKTIDQLKRELETMRNEIIIKDIQHQDDKDHLQKIMEATGIFEKARVLSKFKDLDPDSCKYAKIFYWTLVQYIDAHNILGTKIVAPSIETSLLQELSRSIFKFIGALTGGIPILGEIINCIDTGIDLIYDKIHASKFENKVGIINTILRDFVGSNNLFLEVDLHIICLDAGLLIAKAKFERKSHSSSQHNEKKKIFPSLWGQIEDICKNTKMNSRERNCPITKTAMNDVILMFSYLYKNSKEINPSKGTLQEQLADIVINEKWTKMGVKRANRELNSKDADQKHVMKKIEKHEQRLNELNTLLNEKEKDAMQLLKLVTEGDIEDFLYSYFHSKDIPINLYNDIRDIVTDLYAKSNPNNYMMRCYFRTRAIEQVNLKIPDILKQRCAEFIQLRASSFREAYQNSLALKKFDIFDKCKIMQDKIMKTVSKLWEKNIPGKGLAILVALGTVLGPTLLVVGYEMEVAKFDFEKDLPKICDEIHYRLQDNKKLYNALLNTIDEAFKLNQRA